MGGDGERGSGEEGMREGLGDGGDGEVGYNIRFVLDGGGSRRRRRDEGQRGGVGNREGIEGMGGGIGDGGDGI